MSSTPDPPAAGPRLHEALGLSSASPTGPSPGVPQVAGEELGEIGWDITTTARHLGLSAHTLRYYERIGLVRAPRSSAGHRRYNAAAVRRLVFLTRMRTSGMSISDLRRYVDMVEAGQDTVPQRLALLTGHREALLARIAHLQLALAATDYKIASYSQHPADQPPDAARPGDDASNPHSTSSTNNASKETQR